MEELKFVPCSEEYCKKHYIKYRELVKVNNKTKAFITLNDLGDKIGYSYAFGKPSENHLSFYGSNGHLLTLEECRERIKENLVI